MDFKRYIFTAILFFCLMSCSFELFAQGPPPPPPPPLAVPIDGGILALLGLGAILGIKKLKNKRAD